jgi:hypothetical protein
MSSAASWSAAASWLRDANTRRASSEYFALGT